MQEELPPHDAGGHEIVQPDKSDRFLPITSGLFESTKYNQSQTKTFDYDIVMGSAVPLSPTRRLSKIMKFDDLLNVQKEEKAMYVILTF